jgi:hypothetical protein
MCGSPYFSGGLPDSAEVRPISADVSAAHPITIEPFMVFSFYMGYPGIIYLGIGIN